MSLPLRELIRQRFPDAVPLPQRGAWALPTGVARLDRILPGRGFPRGKLTTWIPHGGAMAVLRAVCHSVIADGERVAWIHGVGTRGAFWEAGEHGPLLIQPAGEHEALHAAQVILRSGGFALVVLTGARAKGVETVRLTRAVREGGGAFVALTPDATLASLKIISRILPQSYQWSRDPFGAPAAPAGAMADVHVRTLGWDKHTTIPLPVTRYELRLSLDPRLADRRGCRR